MGRLVQIGSSNNPVAKENVKKIDIHIGVFFDGTNNNKLNIHEYRYVDPYRPADKKNPHIEDDSYKGDYTNVAKLSEAYNKKSKSKDGVDEYFSSIYIEGIGTAPRVNDSPTSYGGGDSIRGAVTGTGDYGIDKKVALACKKVVERIEKIIKDEEYNKSNGLGSLSLDVFGFSRGAAAARRFVSCLKNMSGELGVWKAFGTEISTANDRSCLMACLKRNNIKVDNICACFLGLFDTVSSHGLNFHNDVKDLALQVSAPKRVVQLAAADEYRNYFALTRIKTAKAGSKEILLPGSHSDIGGGYHDSTDGSNSRIARLAKADIEDVIMDVRYISVDPSLLGSPQIKREIYAGYKTLQELFEEGWITSFDQKKRVLSNQYSLIPLLLMNDYANAYRADTFKTDYLRKQIIPDELMKIKERIDQIEVHPLYYFHETEPVYIKPVFQKGGEDDVLLKSIRSGYLHLSAKKKTGHEAAKNNVRKIIDDSK